MTKDFAGASRLVLLALLAATPIRNAAAHAVAGVRVFPATLTLDDPGVNDEVSLPTVTWNRAAADGGPGPSELYGMGAEWDKTITPDFALGITDGIGIQQTLGGKTATGWNNLTLSGKYQAFIDAPHEFMGAIGVIRAFGGTGTPQNVAAAATTYGSTSLNAYAGKGLGDLPIGLLRPLAVTGQVAYTVSDVGLKATPDGVNSGAENRWFGGFSVQYSLPYLQSQVKDVGLGDVFGRMVPLVEVTWSSPATAPSALGTTWTVAPGIVYMADTYQLAVEALIPGNRNAGTNVGVIAQMHFFLDDIFPDSLGKPLFRN